MLGLIDEVGGNVDSAEIASEAWLTGHIALTAHWPRTCCLVDGIVAPRW